MIHERKNLEELKQLSSNTNMAQPPFVVHDTHMRMVHAHDKRKQNFRRSVTRSKEILKDVMPR